jgi:hypothetical protein
MIPFFISLIVIPEAPGVFLGRILERAATILSLLGAVSNMLYVTYIQIGSCVGGAAVYKSCYLEWRSSISEGGGVKLS